MSFFNNLNFASTVISFGCISFAASNFGIKFGRAITFSNPSGYDYISSSKYKKKLYEAIIEKNKPPFAKDAWKLEQWCKKNERKARKWKDVSEYCLIKNNVRHQLINKGYTIKESTGTTDTDQVKVDCTEEVFESYADDTESSVGFLFAKAKCVVPKEGETVTPAPAVASASST